MSTLADSVLASLDPRTVERMAGQLGIDPQHAGGAISAALPLLLGTMGRNAATPQGAQALHRAATNDHAGFDLGSVIGSVLGGGGSRGPSVGEAILGHVFGARQDRAAAGLGKVAGLDRNQAMQLLAMLAPIVMNMLGRQAQGRGLDAGALGGLLGQETSRHAQSPAGGLLGAVLDRDGDGDVDFDDLMQAGGSGLLGSLFGGGR